MEEIKLSASKREVSTGSKIRILRQDQFVPGVVYGGDKANMNVTVSKKEILKAIHGESGLNAIISLQINGSNDSVLVHDLQRDIISREIIHVDFHRIKLSEKITVKVPVHLTGDAVGHEMGGVVDHMLRELEIECLPADIPPKFEVDITSLNIGEAIIVKTITVPRSVTLLSDPEAIVVHVVTADKEELKPEPTPEELTAEPEVIAKGKEKGIEEAESPKGAQKEDKQPDKEKK